MTLPNTKIGYGGQVLSGASELSELTKWTATPTANSKSYVSAQSQGCERNRTGAKGLSGTCEGNYDWDIPIDEMLKVGDYVTLTLKAHDGDTGRLVPVCITEGPTVTWDAGDLYKWTFSWKNDGPWTEADGTSSAVTS